MATLEILQCFGIGVIAALLTIFVLICWAVYTRYKDFVSRAQAQSKKGGVNVATGDIRVTYDD
jgi:hypothetical protein